ncbi:MAG: hypothetical protein JW913_14675 [Chitinispirillaceae bacterium]|nr:hypothetical protein [Chitinispirillaceae bacterium]
MKWNVLFSSNLLMSSTAVVTAAGIFFFCQNADSEKKASTGTKPVAAQQTATPVDTPAGKATDNSTIAPPAHQQQQKIIVYYFRGTMRCPTCYKLETYTKSEVEASFADMIENGKLEWKTVNVEEPGNKHFGDDYKLYTKSVIVSMVKDGRESSWKNLDKIWQLVHEEGKYRHYIRDEVKACLDGKCL